MNPLVSVIIPCYNAGVTLPGTIESLEAIAPAWQPAVEILAVDDGSSDDTWRLLQTHKTTLAEKGFKVLLFQQDNAGASAARNLAMSHARGDWLFFLDADDELIFDPCEWLNKVSDASPPVSCLGFSQDVVKYGKHAYRRRPRAVAAERHLDVMTSGNPFQPSALLFRRSAVEHPFQTDIRYVEDWVFWATNPKIFSNMVAYPNQCSSRIHIHGSNISAQYARAGEYRARAAEFLLQFYGTKLTRKQLHNLKLQQACGSLQQDVWPGPQPFLRLPCSPTLYAKLLAYAAAKGFGYRATPY